MASPMSEDIPSARMRRKHWEMSWKHLNQQRKQEQLCDIEFQCSGGPVKAHKCVLASVSEYFKVLFTSPISTASSTNVVVFDDFTQEVVALLMDIIYSEVDIPGVHVVELLRLADFVQMQWLVDLLVENIRQKISESNVCDWYVTAKGFGFGKLKFLCECFVRENVEKLQSEDVETCFSSNVFDEMVIWDADLSREVVVINTYQQGQFLIDPKLNSIEMFDDSIVSSTLIDPKLAKFWSGKGDPYTAFIHMNVVYFVTSKYDGDSDLKYDIWKFHHTSRTLYFVFEIKRPDLMGMLSDVATDHVETLYIRQLHYDDQGSLYVLCDLSYYPHTGKYGDILFKFDMRRLKFCKGFVLAENRQLYRVLKLRDYGMCLVTPDYVLSFKKHDFDVLGFPGNALYKVELRESVLNDNPKNNIFRCSRINDFWWEGWRTVNKDGQFYCLVDDDENMEPGTSCNIILKLDMDRCSWVLCDGRVYQCTGKGDGPHQMLFHCGSTLYRHWVEEDGTSPETSYLDEDENVLKTMCLTPKIDYQEIRSYAVVPFHIFI